MNLRIHKALRFLTDNKNYDWELRNLQQEKKDLEAAYNKSVQETFRRAVRSLCEEGWMGVNLNGFSMELPRNTLRTMYHCVENFGENGFQLNVESAHLKWMMGKLVCEATFIDCGCATGATTLPISMHFGSEITILAYEPARISRGLLITTLKRNKRGHVNVRPFAVAQSTGQKYFREYLQDPSDKIPYLLEASSFEVEEEHIGFLSEKYFVETTSLDLDALPLLNIGPVVVKIDVEGFELGVLQGAAMLIKSRQPFFSIDIHADPQNKKETTEQKVRSLLSGYGYQFENLGHVLLCSPLNQSK
jgi:FkbM family methyltransferase